MQIERLSRVYYVQSRDGTGGADRNEGGIGIVTRDAKVDARLTQFCTTRSAYDNVQYKQKHVCCLLFSPVCYADCHRHCAITHRQWQCVTARYSTKVAAILLCIYDSRLDACNIGIIDRISTQWHVCVA